MENLALDMKEIKLYDRKQTQGENKHKRNRDIPMT
jgi:hypothetical protein|tara:strand:+ start:1195 stop:1299 length:105 start_codon:yes stop_codon:yes gene_type:complete